MAGSVAEAAALPPEEITLQTTTNTSIYGCSGSSRWGQGSTEPTLHSEVRIHSSLNISAPKSSIRRFVIPEKAPTRAFSWLKAATTAFTFKTLLRHYAKRALTPRSLNVKLGP